MNLTILMGRLTRDPEVRYTQSEQPVAIARYTLAVDRRGGKKESNEPSADFINCVAFGRLGEFAEKYFLKGMRVLVTWRIQTGSYINREGIKVYTTDIVVQSQEFADSRNGTPGTSEAQPVGEPVGDGFMNIPDGMDDGLPFN